MKANVLYAVIVFVIISTGSAFSQETWKQYTVADGLPANEIRAIVEDASGVKWFGTDGGGVARFDGEFWSVYTEEDGLVYNGARELAIDNDGVL